LSSLVLSQERPTFYGKGPHTSLWAVWQAARGQIAVNVVPTV